MKQLEILHLAYGALVEMCEDEYVRLSEHPDNPIVKHNFEERNNQLYEVHKLMLEAEKSQESKKEI